jgi:hypothetical protein
MTTAATSKSSRAKRGAAFVSAAVLVLFGLGGTASARTNQNASAGNSGGGVATSGGNAASGNTSANTNASAQGAGGVGKDADPGNANQASNQATGAAAVHTGDVTAVGNESTTQISQNGGDTNGVGQDQRQNARVVNRGVAVANSGGNVATGNVSLNTDLAGQGAGALSLVGDASAGNAASASNSSNGSASISTGNVNAKGNVSQSSVSQVAGVNATATGAVPVNQNVRIVNLGVSAGNSGLNAATGNVSNNLLATAQGANATALGFGVLGDAVAGNAAQASNQANGAASVATGNVDTAGNTAANNVNQVSGVNSAVVGAVSHRQGVVIRNVGASVGNSGGNVAVGNLANNTVIAPQFASSLGLFGGKSTAGNAVGSSNSSAGAASISTGNVNADGTVASTSVTQVAGTNAGVVGAADNLQRVSVLNAGLATANSGLNGALGSVSSNVVLDPQLARARGTLGPGDATAGNATNSSNTSDGLASVATGSASAAGSVSNTTLTQVGGNSATLAGALANRQFAPVVNLGYGNANSGLNAAVGSLSRNLVVDPQLAFARAGLVTGDATSGNAVSSTNSAAGMASITTGNADAVGQTSVDVITQVGGNTGGLFGVGSKTAFAPVINTGTANANTGGNFALGNVCSNRVVDPQGSLALGGLFGNSTAGNANNSTNSCVGAATIVTGNATARGNVSCTSIAQGAIAMISPQCPIGQVSSTSPAISPMAAAPMGKALPRTGVEALGAQLGIAMILLLVGEVLRRRSKTALAS